MAEVVAAKPPVAGPESGKKEKEQKVEHRSLEDFAKSLQERIFGKDAAKKTAEATEKIAKKVSVGFGAAIALAIGPE